MNYHVLCGPARTDPERPYFLQFSVLIPDKAGELVRVASIIAQNQGNVIKLDHNQFVTTNRNAAVELKVTMEALEPIIKSDCKRLWKTRLQA